MLATLTTLATIEHWLLVLPVPIEKLWSWATRFRRREGTVTGPPTKSAGKSRFELAAMRLLRAPAPTEMPID